MDLILENLSFRTDTFYERLIEDGFFDQNLFKDLYSYVDSINKSDLSKSDRLEKSNKLWELGFLIQTSLINSLHENDGYKVSNLSFDQIRQLSQMIGYLCKCLTDNTEIDNEILEFGIL
jgi:hypothetical protein